MSTAALPLAGIRVLEFSHVVMGACCGLILADMGAEVIKVERAPLGDDTRRFGGFGVGLFQFFNRNKSSLVIDLKSASGKALIRRAVAEVDVVVENFGPGVMERLGFGYDDCQAINPRIVHCSLKGFLPGPYEHRPSLDNLVQMMGGLAYMTGPRGRPLRAGASVTDILGATFGALGIITALRERDRSGRGQQVAASLFEGTAFLVGQHMAAAAVTGTPLPPMPEGSDPWTVYGLFRTLDGPQVCIGVISDRHWRALCEEFDLAALGADASLDTEAGRAARREFVLDLVTRAVAARSSQEVVACCDRAGVPFAPVNRPDQLFDDPHLNRSGALLETTLPDGRRARLPKLPLRIGAHEFALRNDPPAVAQGTHEFLASLGVDDEELRALADAGVIVLPESPG